VTVLSARDAYPLWAPCYEAETAVSFLEDQLVEVLTPAVAGRRLVDVGCGTGRRLRGADASLAVGVDLTLEMLAAAAGAGTAHFIAGDIAALPLATASFDIVWCRLVIGHLPEAGVAYAELARLCSPGGTVIVTDFHPAAVAAGHRRTFRDGAGHLHEIEHHIHPPDLQIALAGAVGLEPLGRCEGRVGPEIQSFYERSGRMEAYAEQEGLPLVLALSFGRRGSP
jgi:malonyl-CoA O-methyltransferase